MTEVRRAGIFVEASGKDFQAPCRSGRVAVRKDYAAPTALGRIELKIPIKFSTRFGNGLIQPCQAPLNKYIKTVADGGHPDNLLSLPECPP